MLDKIKSYWLIISTALLALFYILWQRRGDSLADVKYQLRRERLSNELEKDKQAVSTATDKQKTDKEAYEALKRKYGSIVDKHGVGVSGDSSASAPDGGSGS